VQTFSSIIFHPQETRIMPTEGWHDVCCRIIHKLLIINKLRRRGPQRNSLLCKELGIVKDIFLICKRGWHGLCYEDESKLGICVNNGVDV